MKHGTPETHENHLGVGSVPSSPPLSLSTSRRFDPDGIGISAALRLSCPLHPDLRLPIPMESGLVESGPSSGPASQFCPCSSVANEGLRLEVSEPLTLSFHLSYESQLVRRRVPCFDPLGQSMLHPDASGMKHGTRATPENRLGFVLQATSAHARHLRLPGNDSRPLLR